MDNFEVCVKDPNAWISDYKSQLSSKGKEICGSVGDAQIPIFNDVECKVTSQSFSDAGEVLACKISFEDAGVQANEVVACKADPNKKHVKNEPQICQFVHSTNVWQTAHNQNLLFRRFTDTKALAMLMIPESGFGACTIKDSSCSPAPAKEQCQADLKTFADYKVTIDAWEKELKKIKDDKTMSETDRFAKTEELSTIISERRTQMEAHLKTMLDSCFPNPSEKNLNSVGRLLYDMRRVTASESEDSRFDNLVSYTTCRGIFNQFNDKAKVLGSLRFGCLSNDLRKQFARKRKPDEMRDFLTENMDNVGSEAKNDALRKTCKNMAMDLIKGAEEVSVFWKNPAITRPGDDPVTKACSALIPSDEDGKMYLDDDAQILPKDDPDSDSFKMKQIERLYDLYFENFAETDEQALGIIKQEIRDFCAMDKSIELGLFDAECDENGNPESCKQNYLCNDLLSNLEEPFDEDIDIDFGGI